MSIDEDDDLGAFFEDISAVEEEARKEIEEKPTDSQDILKQRRIANGQISAQEVVTSGVVAAPSAVVIKREAVITKRVEPTSTAQHESGRTATPFSPPPPPPPPPPPEISTISSSGSFPYIMQQKQQYPYSNNMVSNPAYLAMHHQQQQSIASHGNYPTLMEQQHETAQSKSRKAVKRTAAGKVWEDPTLAEWPENDYRVFVGNLAKDVKNEQLFQHFHSKYPSVALAKIVLDKNKNNISKGYGFVSFLDPLEAARAIREMNETFLGSRPIKLKKSEWKERDLNAVKKKHRKNTF